MPSAKTKFVEVMTLYPQRCVLTGYPNARTQEPALDLGFDLPEYGRVYVSALGMGWVARQFGYVPQKEPDKSVDTVHEDLRVARARIKELEEAMSHVPKTIEGVINGLKSLSVDAITELAGIDKPGGDVPGMVDSKKRAKADSVNS